MKKKVIFDLDGTLALIDKRRELSTKEDGKINWDIFFDPKNIQLDLPNTPIIEMAKMMKSEGHMIIILSGRSKGTKDDVLKMRPTSKEFMYMPDDQLKKRWLDQLFPKKEEILCVFDDRDKVVRMWRDNGLTCLQVGEGNF